MLPHPPRWLRCRRCFLFVSLFLALWAGGGVLAINAQDAVGGYTGAIDVIWSDQIENGVLQSSITEASLVLETGERIGLALSPELLAHHGGIQTLAGTTVTVQGQRDETGMLQAQELAALPALSAALPVEAAGAAANIEGSYPWVVLLCYGAGAGIAHSEPQPYYNALLGGDRYGVDHYWRELSYGKANIAGSAVFGWIDLPEPASAYQESLNGGISINIEKATVDCTAAADPFVNFNHYRGIALILPVPPAAGVASYWYKGGMATMRLEGTRRSWSMVWMPTEVADSWAEGGTGADVLVHEMGHGFGLPHSSGPYGETYDSSWDVMSMSGGRHCSYEPAPFGCAGQHTIAVHKDWLGWLAPGEVVTLGDRSTAEVLLRPLAQPAGSGALMIVAPIDGANHYYTVEARQLQGYDEALDAESVIIHDVDTGRSTRPARVVDPDGNGNPNDAGAQWLPGERFDGAGGFHLCVKGRRPEGFVVAVARNQALDCTYTPDLSPSTWSAGTMLPSAGQTVTVQIDLVNYQAPAANVVLTATIPAATTYVTGTATTTQGSVTLTNTNQLVLRAGSLTYDKPVVLTYDVVVKPQVTAPTSIVHSAAITWSQGRSSLQMGWIANARKVYLPHVQR